MLGVAGLSCGSPSVGRVTAGIGRPRARVPWCPAVRRYAYWLCASLVLAACKHDEFILGFDQLCPLRAEDICSARAACCAEEALAPDCVAQETQVCEAQRQKIAGVEAQLQYDSRTASDKLDEEQAALLECGAPLPVPSFFEGAAALDEPCTRDTQCASGRCGDESGVCESADEVTLCPAE
jgi:hypothetical protein